MNFTEFNESVDIRLNDLSELSEKYDIFNESVAEQLNINIEKAKVYVEESGGTEEDLIYLINEAKGEASSKFSSSLNKLQKSTVNAFSSMADDLSKFADSAKLSVVMNKLKGNKELAEKKVNVELSKNAKVLDKARSDVMAKLTVLETNINAVMSEEELNKLNKEIDEAFDSAMNEVDKIECKAVDLLVVYNKKLDEIRSEISADKNISVKMDGISSKSDKWETRSDTNKSQIMKLVGKLTAIMSKKVSILKSDIAKISAAIKAPKTEEKEEEPKKESVNVSDLLDSIIEEKIEEISNNVEVKEEADEADKILAEIEAEITESENKKIDEVNDITFDESTNVDDVVNNLLEELL